MHGVVAQSLDANRSKRANTDVQSHERSRNAPLLTAHQQLGCEMQPGRRGRDGSRPGRESRLVSLPIQARAEFAVDVRRQRDSAELFEQLDGVLAGGRGRRPNSLGIAIQKGQLESLRRVGPMRGAITRGSPDRSRPPACPISLQWPAASTSRKSPSHLPPVALRTPKRRAGTTRVSLRTNLSPGRKISDRSPIDRCSRRERGQR